MKLKIYFVTLLLLGILTTSFADDEEEESDDDERPRSCGKYTYDFLTEMITDVLKCLSGQSTFKMNSIFELGTRAGCLLKCILQQHDVIGLETGRLDEIAAAFYFEGTFDQPVRDVTLPEAQACFPLADQFNPKEYWCKSYIPFVECALKAIIKGMIPYVGDCIATPTIGILFSAMKYLAPDSPGLAESVEELKRAMHKNKTIKCLDKNCTRMYEYKKVNGTKSVVIYNKDKEVVSVETKKPPPQMSQSQPQKKQQQPFGYNNNYNYGYNSNINSNIYSYKYEKYQNPQKYKMPESK